MVGGRAGRMMDETTVRVLQVRIAALEDALQVAEEECALMRPNNIPDRIAGLLRITQDRLKRLEKEHGPER
jgi:hypothetical protein